MIVAIVAGIILMVLFLMPAHEQVIAPMKMPADTSLHGRRLFGPDDPWNTDISNLPVDENSNALIASIGADVPLHPDFGFVYRGVSVGIPYVLVNGDQSKVLVTFREAAESDPGPYPIPPDAPVEPNGDRHVLVLDCANWKLYELYNAFAQEGGKAWNADSGAIFDLNKPSTQRPIGWTSADAAGLPIFPGLVRYDEVVEQGRVTHALRFTVKTTRRAFVPPAMHYSGRATDPGLPPMGMRVRLKRDYDISGFPPSAQVILRALKTHGMFLCDMGGDWFLSGAPDSRWNSDEIQSLKRVKGSAFEVVRMEQVVTELEKPH